MIAANPIQSRLNNHFDQKTDLACSSSTMSQRNYVFLGDFSMVCTLWYSSEFWGLYRHDGAAPSHVVVHHWPSERNAFSVLALSQN